MASKIKPSSLVRRPPIISIKEARKLIGVQANAFPDEELTHLIADYEVLARQAIRDYLVRKWS